jgi:hypothetical protein
MLTYVGFVADGSYHFLGNFRRGQRKLGNFHRLGQNRQKSLFSSVFVSVFIVVEVNTVAAASTSMTGMSSSTASIIASFCHPCLGRSVCKNANCKGIGEGREGVFRGSARHGRGRRGYCTEFVCSSILQFLRASHQPCKRRTASTCS